MTVKRQCEFQSNNEGIEGLKKAIYIENLKEPGNCCNEAVRDRKKMTD